MSELNLGLYIVTFGLWFACLRREDGIGIGIRFMFALNMALFFLVGPLLGQLFDSADPRFMLPMYDATVRVSLFALLAFLAGSYLVYPALLHRGRLVPPDFAAQLARPRRMDAQWKVGCGLIAFGFASLPIYQRLRFIPTVGAMAGLLPDLVDAGLVMLCLYTTQARKRVAALTGVLVLLIAKGVVVSAMSGHAGGIFFTGMFLACMAFISCRFRLKTLAGLAVVGMIAFLPAQSWLIRRAQLRAAIQQGQGLEERLEIVKEIFFDFGSTSIGDQNMVSAYRSRGDFSDIMAAALAHTPKVQPYAEGETYLDVLFALIPRFLWPDKPLSAGGSEFVSKYTGLRFGQNTSVGMHHMFELYINFGTAGVVIGMFMLGLFIGWMESLYYRKGLDNLLFEFGLVFCSWSVCFYCDTMKLLVMTLPPAIALCVCIYTVLRLQIYSPYLPSLWWREDEMVSHPGGGQVQSPAPGAVVNPLRVK